MWFNEHITGKYRIPKDRGDRQRGIDTLAILPGARLDSVIAYLHLSAKRSGLDTAAAGAVLTV